jgi:hypothetical protein
MSKIYTRTFLVDELRKLNRSDSLTPDQHRKKMAILEALNHYRRLKEICGMIKLSVPETRWGTPPEYIELVREVFNNRIDLDPASEPIFNKNVGAERIFTKEQDGLAQEWIARTVFCNSPYGNALYDFIEKAIEEIKKENCESVLLLGSRRGSKKYRSLVKTWLSMGGLILQHHKRIAFVDPRGQQQPSPRHDADTWYLGPIPKKFREVFGPLGDVIDKRYLEMI